MGIASVGYATLLLDDKEQPCRILKMNSRIFEAAEHPKDGSSLAAPRRINRGMRRRLRRRRFRKEQIRDLIAEKGIMTTEEIDEIYNSGKELSDIYEIRAEALDRILSKEEFVRLMIENGEHGTFWPQNPQYSNTSEVISLIAKAHNKRCVLIPGFGWALKRMSHATGLVNKAFGNLAYDQSMSVYKEPYQKFSLQEAIEKTEG